MRLQALDDNREATWLEPENPRHFHQRAWLYFALGDLDAAERDFGVAIHLRPNSFYYWSRGHFYGNIKKDLPKALADFTMAIQQAEREQADTGHSEYPIEWLYRDRGELYEALGEPDKAAADFEKAKQR